MYFFKCHNCGVGCTLRKFLELQHPHLVPEYRLDKFKEQSGKTGFVKLPEKEVESPEIIVKSNGISLDRLESTHQAVQYVQERMIPLDRYADIGFTENFSKWVSDACTETKYKKLPTDARILFEMRDRTGNLFGVSARSIDDSKSGLRYITLKFDDAKPKIYGLESVNTSQTIIVVEGAVDSLFLPNAVALCGGDVIGSIENIKNYDCIIALDNEPRSKDTISRMQTAISKGLKVCFWKINPKLKDINQMVKSGISKESIYEHIKENSYSGLRATAMMNQWKKL